jgi:leucyl/phenylalanyl-tRNA--protein transferase
LIIDVYLSQELYFPDVALTHSSGIIAFMVICHQALTFQLYKSGIFPWFGWRTHTWWSPNPSNGFISR